MTAFGPHPEVAAAAADMRDRAFDLAHLHERETDSDPGEWLRSYAQADAAYRDAEVAHASAVLWADLDDAVAYRPAPQEPEAGQ